jgi:RecA/RadA recombinase
MARRKPTEEGAADFAPPLPPKHPGARVFADLAASTESFRPARETLKRVRAVSTIFPDVDRKTRVGGWPIERVSLVHGPSAAGKTLLCHGVGLSFLRRGHMYNLIDAELTTPITWLDQLLGPHADSSAFLASRPHSYEQAVDDIRRVAEGLAEAREKERVAPDTSALFVVDSIRKLVPKDLMKRIARMGAEGEKGSVDGYGGGAARLKANLNASWLDELGPLMYRTGCAIILVGRESDDATADARDRQFGNDWKLTGGKALFFDSSLVVRVSLAGKVTVGGEDSKVVVGERHLVEIHKTKVSAKQDRVEKAYFHTTERGFDRARDVLRLADEYGLVKKSGAWLSLDGHRFQGEARFAETVPAGMLDELEAACRAKFEDESKALADHV